MTVVPLSDGMDEFIRIATAAHADGESGGTPLQRRLSYLAYCRRFEQARPAGITIEDTAVSGSDRAVGVRLYRTEARDTLPAIVFFHGGGWVVGGIESHDVIAAGLAQATGAAVIAVDYRLAPEHRYPAAFDDAYLVVEHVATRAAAWDLDGDRLVVCGDSAGGNLAAAVALAVRDRNGPALAGQALVYPALDPALDTTAARQDAVPLLSTEDMRRYWQDYLGEEDPEIDSYAAPLRARDLGGLAPAFIATAGLDPLADDGRLYAERLRAAGVAVEHHHDAGLLHGYLRARFISRAASAGFDALAAAIRAMLR